MKNYVGNLLNCFWLPKNILLLINRPEGERLLLCAEHMQ